MNMILLLILSCSIYAADSNFVNVLYPKTPEYLTEFQFDQNKEGCVVQCVRGDNIAKWKADHTNIYIYCVEVFNAKDTETFKNNVFFIIAYKYKEIDLEKK